MAGNPSLASLGEGTPGKRVQVCVTGESLLSSREGENGLLAWPGNSCGITGIYIAILEV